MNGSDDASLAKLVDQIGFDAADNGTIADSCRRQPGIPVHCKDFDAAGVRAALQQARPERAVEWTETSHSPGTFESPR